MVDLKLFGNFIQQQNEKSAIANKLDDMIDLMNIHFSTIKTLESAKAEIIQIIVSEIYEFLKDIND